MSWKNHIQSVCLNLSKTCGIIYQIRHSLTTDALRNIYYSLCYPYITYCVAIWGCTWPTIVNDVFVSQKKLIRIISFKGKYDHTNVLFNDLGILKFDFVRKYFMLLNIYNEIHKRDETNKIFALLHHGYGTRGNNIDLVFPQARTTLCKFSILCAGPQCWNELPNDLKSITNFNTFKIKIKRYLYKVQNQNFIE